MNRFEFRVWSFGLILFTLHSSPIPAATITGTVRDRRGGLVSTNINFLALQRPLFVPPFVQPGWTLTTNSASDGTFSVFLLAGNYRATFGSAAADSVVISVPDDLLTYSIGNITTNAVTFAHAVPPSTYPLMVGASAGANGQSGLVLGPVAGQEGYFWRGDGTWAPAAGGGLSDGDKGDITISGGVWTIDPVVVTDAKVAASGITTRSKLPGPLAYEDEANTFSLLNIFSGIVDTRNYFTNSSLATLNGVLIGGSINSVGAANTFAQDVTFNGPVNTTGLTNTGAFSNAGPVYVSGNAIFSGLLAADSAFIANASSAFVGPAQASTNFSGLGTNNLRWLKLSGGQTNNAVAVLLGDTNLVGHPTVSVTELGFIDGLSSSAQTQLDGKQPLDSDLTAIAALSTTAFGRGLLDDADAAAGRTSLGVVIGTDVQAFDADLADLADGSLTGSKVGDGIDDDFVSFDDADNLWTATKIGPALEELNDSINAGSPNGTGAKVHWSQLLGVPAGFADGTDDGAGGGAAALGVTSNNVVRVTNVAVLSFTNDTDIVPIVRSNAVNQAEIRMNLPFKSGSGNVVASNAPTLNNPNILGAASFNAGSGAFTAGYNPGAGPSLEFFSTANSYVQFELTETSDILAMGNMSVLPGGVGNGNFQVSGSTTLFGLTTANTNLIGQGTNGLRWLKLTGGATNDRVAIVAGDTNVVGHPTVTVAELGFIGGLSSSAQTQLDGKQPLDADLTDLADGSLTGSKVGDGIDDDFVSFDDADGLWTATKIGPALEELNDIINAGVPNGAGAKVHWSELLGVPAGFADGTDDGGAGGTPAGNHSQVQFNSNGVFQASQNFTYDPTNSRVGLQIGSATRPNTALEIGGAGTVGTQIRLGGSGTGKTNLLDSDGIGQITDAALKFYINGGDAWYMDASPRYGLHPVGTNSSDLGTFLEPVGTNWATWGVFKGGLKIVPDAGSGKVLTSDASGNGTWQTPAAGGGTNFDSLIINHQALFGRENIDGGTAATNLSFNGATRKVMTNGLITDITYTLSNLVDGASMEVELLGQTNAANNRTITINVIGGATLQWRAPTNGVNSFQVDSNSVVTASFSCSTNQTGTNITAFWSSPSGWPLRNTPLIFATGGSTSNTTAGGLTYYDYAPASYTNHSGNQTFPNANYTNLASVFLPAHGLTNLGDSYTFVWRGTFRGANNGTNQLICGIGTVTNGLGDTGQFTNRAACAWEYKAELTAIGPTNFSVYWQFQLGGPTTLFGSITNYQTRDFATGILTNGVTNIVRLQHKGVGPGAISNDFFKVYHQPGSR